MKKYILIAIVFAFFFVLAAFGYKYLSAQYKPNDAPSETGVSESGSAAAAQTAKDFTVLDADGNEVKLSDFFGKPIVVNFWATWCGPCKYELPGFDRIYAEHGDDVVFLMVNLTDGFRDTIDSVKQFVSDEGYSFPVLFDTRNSAANAYSISSIPLTVLIDKNGAVVKSHIGVIEESALLEYINILTGGAE